MTKTALDELKRVLKEHRKEYFECLSELVSRNTQVLDHGVSGGFEKNGQEYLRNLYDSLDGDVHTEALTEEIIQRGIENYGEGNPGHNYQNGDRYNLVAHFAGRKGGRSILFDCHVDTMPPGDVSLWKSDPYVLTPEGERVRGLGVCDMKAGLAAASMSVKLLRDAGRELPGDVIILSVVDEEGGGNGSLAAMLAGHRADAAVVCEPSDRSITLAHMGFVFFQISVQGAACHSGKKWDGINAIEKAILLIQALNDMEREWLMRYKHPLLPPPTLNIGVIDGGTAGSTVPDRCIFKTCVHYLPKVMSYSSVKKEVVGTLNRRAEGDEWLRKHKPVTSVYQAGGAFEQEKSSPFVKTAERCMAKTLGNAPISGCAAGNDARLLKTIGGLPTIIAGPGSLSQCHTVNESIEVRDYMDFILFYATLILDWCSERQKEEGQETK
jgi:acetylornithine deacetylase